MLAYYVIPVFLVWVTVVIVNPAFAILGLPDTFNSADNNTSSQTQAQTQTTQGFSTYQDPKFGFTVEYPSDWRANHIDLTPLMIETNTKYPGFAALNTVSFKLDNDTESSIRIIPLNLAKYLDSNDMKVKNKTAHDFITDTINYMNSCELCKPGLLFQTIYKPIKDMATTVGKNHYPAWRLDSSVTAFGNTDMK